MNTLVCSLHVPCGGVGERVWWWGRRSEPAAPCGDRRGSRVRAWTQDARFPGVRIPRGGAGAPRAWAMAVAALLRLRRGRLLSWRAGRPNLRHSTFLVHAILLLQAPCEDVRGVPVTVSGENTRSNRA